MMIAIEVTAVPEHPEPTVTETMKIALVPDEVERILNDRLNERMQLALREGVAEMIRNVVRDAESEHERRVQQ